MLKVLIGSVCGISLASSVYMTGWSGKCGGSAAMLEDGSCCVVSPDAGSTAAVETLSADEKTKAVDVKNTKCIVSGEDKMGEGAEVVYQGKLYHLCCDGCLPDFKKDPEKYVKAFEADPAKFGVKAQ